MSKLFLPVCLPASSPCPILSRELRFPCSLFAAYIYMVSFNLQFSFSCTKGWQFTNAGDPVLSPPAATYSESAAPSVPGPLEDRAPFILLLPSSSPCFSGLWWVHYPFIYSPTHPTPSYWCAGRCHLNSRW